MPEFKYGIDELTPQKALQIARSEMKGVLCHEVEEAITGSQLFVKQIVDSDEAVYGINTGFGALCSNKIDHDDTKKLQKNLIMSHATGVGNPIPVETAKLMMIMKVHSLAKGFSGISFKVVERICFHIDNDLIPEVPEKGSVGASGDLAPLAHLFLPLIGLGKLSDGKDTNPCVEFKDSAEVFKKHGLEALELGPKEGIALLNGTQFIAAFATQVAERLANCLDAADLIAAMSLEALLGSIHPFDEKLHELRPYDGTKLVASRFRKILADSDFIKSHEACERVQDPYSLRCIPQVHGASREAWMHLVKQLTCELNSVTDNPVIFSANETISGGNFHGQPMALPLDYAAVAASEIGNISDRRIFLMHEGKWGLPVFLVEDTGLNSGMMIHQYSAAALVSENKSLCYPASADSIPTCIGQEDHVSMGSISARKALEIVKNTERILAFELISAAQAFEFRRPLKSSKILEACHKKIREYISFTSEDKTYTKDIKAARDLIVKGELLGTASKAGLEASF